MTEAKQQQKRPRNSIDTRETILDAAEKNFSTHGFDGARVAIIAKTSGYNQGLIFRYFRDKLGLYVEVLKRIEAEINELITQQLAPLFDDKVVTDTHRLRAYFVNLIGLIYDYMVAHPQLMRLMIWEHAENWQTYSQLTTLFENTSLDLLKVQFTKGQKAGLIRGDCDPLIILLLAEQICWIFPSSFPYYRLILPESDLASNSEQPFLRRQVINFIVSGILIDPQDAST